MPLRISPEKKEEKERIARELLRATLRLSMEHGFSSLGLREVARAAKIAPTSFYRHFPDMEQLGLALIDQLAGEMLDAWLDLANERRNTDDGVIRALASAAIHSVGADPELVHFVVAERVGAVASFRAAMADKLEPLSAALVEAFVADGMNRDAVVTTDVADAAVALLMETCSRALDRPPEERAALEERFGRQARTLVRGAKKGDP